jgi:hypothetical protein
MRQDIAYSLAQKAEIKTTRVPSKKETKTNYDILGNGSVKSMAETLPMYSLENMQKELNSNSPVSNLYNEHISNMINKDIYILSADKKDVYMFGDDYSLLYKNRDSIVIIYLTGHYELVGLRDQEGVEKTLFSYKHPFIQLIRERIETLCAGSFKTT